MSAESVPSESPPPGGEGAGRGEPATCSREAIFALALFGVCMALMESSVVVYLREIYYPDGFGFPIRIILETPTRVERFREFGTLVMILSVSMLACRGAWQRFGAFMFVFGVWDIFYYVWLWVFLRWPPSLLTWDILFLIPVPWIAPVLAPALIAAAMVVGSVILLRLKARGVPIGFSRSLWALAVAGGLIVLLSFTIDFHVVLDGRMPTPFRWWLYGIGFAMAVAALILGVRRLSRTG